MVKQSQLTYNHHFILDTPFRILLATPLSFDILYKYFSKFSKNYGITLSPCLVTNKGSLVFCNCKKNEHHLYFLIFNRGTLLLCFLYWLNNNMFFFDDVTFFGFFFFNRFFSLSSLEQFNNITPFLTVRLFTKPLFGLLNNLFFSVQLFKVLNYLYSKSG